jgi:hypothetical protein
MNMGSNADFKNAKDRNFNRDTWIGKPRGSRWILAAQILTAAHNMT